jgi:hypothetical protein
VGARIASTNRPGAGVEPEKKSSGSMSSSSTTSGSPSDPQSRSTLANRRSLPTASDLAGSERRHGVEPVTLRGEPHRGRDTRAVAAEARDAQVLARDPLDVGRGRRSGPTWHDLPLGAANRTSCSPTDRPGLRPVTPHRRRAPSPRPGSDDPVPIGHSDRPAGGRAWSRRRSACSFSSKVTSAPERPRPPLRGTSEPSVPRSLVGPRLESVSAVIGAVSSI